MNNAKMWLVVPPAVGVPVFLGAVAVGSFAVHVAVVSNTSWVSDFISGEELGGDDDDDMASATMLPDPNAAQAAFVTDTVDGQEILVVMPDGTTATAVLKPDTVLASAEAMPLVIDQ